MNTKRKPYDGNTYGRLTVLRDAKDYVTSTGLKKRRVLCQCTCGKKVIRLISSLVSGHTQSCGCLRSEGVQRAKTISGDYALTRPLTLNGKTKSLEEWSRITGIAQGTIKSRLNRLKWPVEKALTQKVRPWSSVKLIKKEESNE